MLGTLLYLSGLSERRCCVCGLDFFDREQGYVCGECLRDIRPHHPTLYGRLEWVSSWRVFGRYEGVLGEVIRLVKFRAVRPLARKLGEIVREHMLDFIGEVKPDLITWVPIHPLRFWNRGFDHNLEILKGVGVEAKDLLVRVRYSKPLASVGGREERMRRVRGAFRVRREMVDEVEGKRILLFDDVLTTGSTASSVAEHLLSLGVEEVFLYCLAKEA